MYAKKDIKSIFEKSLSRCSKQLKSVQWVAKVFAFLSVNEKDSTTNSFLNETKNHTQDKFWLSGKRKILAILDIYEDSWRFVGMSIQNFALERQTFIWSPFGLPL